MFENAKFCSKTTNVARNRRIFWSKIANFCLISSRGGHLTKFLTGVCRPWYDTLYPIVGQILDKTTPYCRANFPKIFKNGQQNDIILSENAKFCSKTTNVARNRIIFLLKSPIFFQNTASFCKYHNPIVGQNLKIETLL